MESAQYATIGNARERYLSGIGAMSGGCCERVYEGNGGRLMAVELNVVAIVGGC